MSDKKIVLLLHSEQKESKQVLADVIRMNIQSKLNIVNIDNIMDKLDVNLIIPSIMIDKKNYNNEEMFDELKKLSAPIEKENKPIEIKKPLSQEEAKKEAFKDSKFVPSAQKSTDITLIQKKSLEMLEQNKSLMSNTEYDKAKSDILFK